MPVCIFTGNFALGQVIDVVRLDITGVYGICLGGGNGYSNDAVFTVKQNAVYLARLKPGINILAVIIFIIIISTCIISVFVIDIIQKAFGVLRNAEAVNAVRFRSESAVIVTG